MNDIDAFILIGGRSTRMGVDKATVSFDGSLMISRIAVAIREALPGDKIRLVAANAEQIASLGGFEPADGFVLDLYENRGPAGGLYAALANTEKTWAFVIACDLPLISAELIELLASKIDTDLDVAVPIQPDGRVQPLAGFYRVKSVRDLLSELFDRPRPTPSMVDVVANLRAKYVTFDEIEALDGSDAFFTNVNSPTDL